MKWVNKKNHGALNVKQCNKNRVCISQSISTLLTVFLFGTLYNNIYTYILFYPMLTKHDYEYTIKATVNNIILFDMGNMQKTF